MTYSEKHEVREEHKAMVSRKRSDGEDSPPPHHHYRVSLSDGEYRQTTSSSELFAEGEMMARLGTILPITLRPLVERQETV